MTVRRILKTTNAWAVVDKRGRIIWDCYGQPVISKKRDPSSIQEEGERLVRVKITAYINWNDK